MSAELLKYLSNKVQEEMVVIEKDMALGNSRDFGDYKYACGIVRGLRIANNLFIETAEKMERDNG